MSSDKPMTDEELAEIKAGIKETQQAARDYHAMHARWEPALAVEAANLYVFRTVPALVAEVERLRAENAALREFVQVVADNSYASERDLVESARALLEGVRG